MNSLKGEMNTMESDSPSDGAAAISLKDGRSDLLMRFFESDFFDAWIAVTYVS